MAYYKIAQQVFAEEAAALTNVSERLDASFDQLVEQAAEIS
ncbi:hypothetical protein LACFE_CDS0278 [Limosilactobacillus fermentum]|nr:hypothetical protein LACFE_CDS0278 [Limosilactobacillus fermentum]